MNHQVEMIGVSSSNVASIGYDPTRQRLYVQYQGGKNYEYRGVPPRVHTDLMRSQSKGTFMHERIKPVYPVVKG